MKASPNEPPPDKDSNLHLFRRLADWMTTYAPIGCLALTALVSHPDNKEVRGSTRRHKAALIKMMARRNELSKLFKELFLLHQGASAAWPEVGIQAIQSAETAILKLMDGDRNG